MKRLVLVVAVLAACAAPQPITEQPSTTPNIVILFADDLGYGDLSSYGHPSIRTPHLDRMATEGMRFTQFYSAATVCTPSRAALLTGRLPIRNGMTGDNRRVLFPNSALGISDNEITLAEALKQGGYATACIGKWHLGHLPEFLPTRHGFDYYFGLPYSNDMDNQRRGDPPVPLMRNEDIIEQPALQETLTQRYTEEAIRFIREHRDGPFFLYLPYTFPHVPLFASDRFRGSSARGLYGDVVEEIDWSAGQILEVLRELGLEENSLVFFTSDNGPWLTKFQEGGSAGLLRGGKGSTWEGGVREPAIAWWPGRIPAGRVTHALGSTMDLFTTSLTLAGVPLPEDRIIDGQDLSTVLLGLESGPRETLEYYRGSRLMAFRQGPWKMHFITQAGYREPPEIHSPPLLYHLQHDPSEQYDVSGDHPDVVEQILQAVESHKATLKPFESRLEAQVAN